MRLLLLELENWAVHSSLKIPLDQSLQIEGRNGTGKSSILEAIRFIFAKDARNYKRYIKNGSRSSRIMLKFSEKGREYVVEKGLHISSPATAKMFMGDTIIASTPTEVYDRLQDILPENVLEELLYVPQDALVELIDKLRSKDGRQELDALLGLDRFKTIYDEASTELKEKNVRLQGVDDQLKRYESNTEEECNKQILELHREIKLMEENTLKEREALKNVEAEILKIKTDLEDMQKKKKKREETEKRINELRLIVAEYRKEVEALNENIHQISVIKEELQKLKKKFQELEKYSEFKEPLSQMMKLKERLGELSDIEEKKKQLNELNKELKLQQELKKKESELEEALLSKERDLAAVESQLTEKREYIRSLRQLDGEATCPRCGQPITRDHINRELKSAKENEEENSEKASTLRKEIKDLKEDLSKLKHEIEKLKDTELKAECLRIEIAEKTDEEKRIKSKIVNIEKELKHLGYMGEPPEDIEEKLSELDKLSGKISEQEKAVRQEDYFLKKKEKIESTLRTKDKEINELKESMISLKYDENLFERLQKEKETLQEGAHEIHSRIRENEIKVEYKKKEIESLESKKREFTDIKAKADALRKETHLLQEALDIFHTNKGIVKYLREKYISQLSTQMSFYFRRINQNPKYREIVFDKDYRMEVMTTDGSFPIDQLSGGEKVQLAIALRIALIRMRSPISLLILDEPFGSLDQEHREVLGEALNKVASDGQLILVTHVNVDSLNLSNRLNLGGY